MGRILFVTGTDTGVGKTLLTASLLHHLRARGVDALAMKPFCSGGPADVDLFLAVQGARWTRREVNPFYFSKPLAPLVAARRSCHVRLADVLAAIRRNAAQCDCLLVEGSGGLLAPLGRGYDARDLIARLACSVVVVARNRLGTLNHCLLTVEALRRAGLKRLALVLMDTSSPDVSAASNPAVLRELLLPVPVWPMPFLGPRAATASAVRRNAKSARVVLRRLWRQMSNDE